MTSLVLARSSDIYRRLPGRALLLVALVVAAYHYSLLSLVRGLTLQTPLAYLGLVPIIALGLGTYRGVQRSSTGPYDLRLDFSLGRLLGLALVTVTVAIAALVPRTSGIGFWLLRVDLLTLPLFVSGLVALLFGVRRLWSLRFPIAFLLLAWPAPYVAVTGEAMRVSVDATVGALAQLAAILPFASPLSGSPGMFLIGSGGDAIPVSVASACSGVNSAVGFLIMGTALTSLMRGSTWRRVAWLAAGIVLTWILNLLRIELIFLVGAVGSPQVALNVLHPVAGLIVFNIGIVAMLLTVNRFGLEFEMAPLERKPKISGGPSRRFIVPAAIAAAAALSMSLINASYAGYQPIGGDLGVPILRGFQPSTAWVANWSSRSLASYQHGRQFFGEDSTWIRSVYSPLGAAEMRANVPVYVDVISTDQAAALAGYTVEACYNFHGYTVQSSQVVALAPGVDAYVKSYSDPRGETNWTILFWEWPYQTGETVRHQRVVLMIPDGDTARFVGVPSLSAGGAGRYAEAESLAIVLAQAMVGNQLGLPNAGEGG